MSFKKGQTKTLTSSGVISTVSKPARIWAITLLSGTAAGSITINNGGSGGSAVWALATAATTNAGDNSTSVSFPQGLVCSTDAYGTLAGTAAIAWICYDELE